VPLVGFETISKLITDPESLIPESLIPESLILESQGSIRGFEGFEDERFEDK